MDVFASFHRRTLRVLGRLSAAGVLPAGVDLARSSVAPCPAGSRFDLVLDAALVHARDAAAAGTEPSRLARTLTAELSAFPDVEAAELAGSGLIAVALRAGARLDAVAAILRNAPGPWTGARVAGAGQPVWLRLPTLADARAAILAEIAAALAAAVPAPSAAGVRPGRGAPPRPGPVVVVRREGRAAVDAAQDRFTCADVVAAVGVDAFRIAAASRRSDATLRVDLDALADRSSANPAFWLPYAHARFRVVLRRASLSLPGVDLTASALAEADLGLLADPGEVALVRLLARHAHAASTAAAGGLPHLYAAHLADLAEAVHRQWNRSKDQPQLRFVNEEQRDLSKARLALVTASAIVLKSGLGILGVDAPDEMR